MLLWTVCPCLLVYLFYFNTKTKFFIKIMCIILIILLLDGSAFAVRVGGVKLRSEVDTNKCCVFPLLRSELYGGLAKPSIAAAPLERRKEIHNIYWFPPLKDCCRCEQLSWTIDTIIFFLAYLNEKELQKLTNFASS